MPRRRRRRGGGGGGRRRQTRRKKKKVLLMMTMLTTTKRLFVFCGGNGNTHYLRRSFFGTIRSSGSSGSDHYMVVGLGNHTMASQRHSVGFRVVERLCDRLDLRWSDRRSLFGRVARCDSNKIFLLRPTLFMNESGKSVSRAMKEYGIPSGNIIVVHDDLEKPLGKIRFKEGGSANGQNGVKSIMQHAQTSAFPRLRIGIGRPSSRDPAAVSRYVLSKFTREEQSVVEGGVVESACDAILQRLDIDDR